MEPCTLSRFIIAQFHAKSGALELGGRLPGKARSCLLICAFASATTLSFGETWSTGGTAAPFWMYPSNATTNIGIGGNYTPVYQFQIFKNSGEASEALTSYGNRAALYFERVNGTQSAQANVIDGDPIGIIQANARSTSNMATAAIGFKVDGAVTAGQRPGAKIDFYTNTPNGAQTVNMVIRNDGRVGIGTTTPTQRLDVAGAAQVGGRLTVYTSSDQIQIQTDNTGKTWRLGTGIGGAGANRNFTIWDSDRGNVFNINQTNGGIGIGTFNPTAFLHVYGAGVGSGMSGIDITNNVSPGHTFKLSAGIKNVSEGGFTIMDRTAGDIPRLVIDNNGNVGIGTTNATKTLEVGGMAQINGRIIANTASDQIQIQNDASGKSWRMGTGIGNAGVNRNFTIWDTDLGNVLTINQANGGVGVGTVNPTAYLHVYGAGVGSGMSGIDITNNVAPGHTFKISAGIKNVGEGGFTIMDRTAGDVSRIAIDNNGNVGIGTTNPTKSLEVAGMAQFNGRIIANASSDQIQIEGDGSGKSWRMGTGIGNSGANRNFTIWDTDVGNAFNINQSTGNVGIGTTTPSEKLDVNGNVKVSGNLQVASINTKVWSIAPDYVFEKDYQLASLEHVEKYVDEHKHLPEIPSAKDFEEKGVDLAEMNMKLLRKVEELTLYAIQQEKKDKQRDAEIAELRRQISRTSGGK